jgi:hypothetical protein
LQLLVHLLFEERLIVANTNMLEPMNMNESLLQDLGIPLRKDRI